MPAPELPPWPKGLPEEEERDGGVWYPEARAVAIDVRLEACDLFPARAAERIAEQAAQDDARMREVVVQQDAAKDVDVARARADAPGVPVITALLGGAAAAVLGAGLGALAVYLAELAK